MTRPRLATATAIVVGIAVVSAAMVISASVARTLVPHHLEGRIEALDERNHNSHGSDIWLLRFDDGRAYFIDDVPARTVREGATIHKDAWSREVTVDGERRSIGASREALGPPLWALTVACLAIGLAVLRPRSGSAPAAPPSEPAANR
jgi:hypothetical protein